MNTMFFRKLAEAYQEGLDILDQYDRGGSKVMLSFNGDDDFPNVPDVVWTPTVEEVLELHSLASPAPLIHPAEDIQGAVCRPDFCLAYEENPTLAHLAYVLAEGLIEGHYWADGNKRTAFLTIAAFLRLNEAHIDVVPLAVWILGIAEKSWSQEDAERILNLYLEA